MLIPSLLVVVSVLVASPRIQEPPRPEDVASRVQVAVRCKTRKTSMTAWVYVYRVTEEDTPTALLASGPTDEDGKRSFDIADLEDGTGLVVVVRASLHDDHPPRYVDARESPVELNFDLNHKRNAIRSVKESLAWIQESLLEGAGSEGHPSEASYARGNLQSFDGADLLVQAYRDVLELRVGVAEERQHGEEPDKRAPLDSDQADEWSQVDAELSDVQARLAGRIYDAFEEGERMTEDFLLSVVQNSSDPGATHDAERFRTKLSTCLESAESGELRERVIALASAGKKADATMLLADELAPLVLDIDRIRIDRLRFAWTLLQESSDLGVAPPMSPFARFQAADMVVSSVASLEGMFFRITNEHSQPLFEEVQRFE